MLQIYFRLWECKIYQNRLRFARVVAKSLLPRVLCPTVYFCVRVSLSRAWPDGVKYELNTRFCFVRLISCAYVSRQSQSFTKNFLRILYTRNCWNRFIFYGFNQKNGKRALLSRTTNAGILPKEIFFYLFVCRLKRLLLMAAGAYCVGHSGRSDLFETLVYIVNS